MSKTDLNSIIELLKSGNVKKLLITSGANVDPDAVGSMLAVAQGLSSLIPSIDIAVEDFDPQSYANIQGSDRIHNTDEWPVSAIYDVIVVVDTAKKSLIGQWITDPRFADISIINIDHHQDNEKFGTHNYLLPAASATIVVYELFKELGVEVSDATASYLLIGVLGDTSGFANANTDASVLRFAAEMLDYGVDMPTTMANLFRNMSFTAIKLWGHILANATKEESGIIVAQLSQEDIASLGATDADVSTTAGLVNNILVSDRSAKLAVMLKDKGQGEVTVSMRSIGNIDVSSIARQMGGGGHVRAAACRLTNTTLAEARNKTILTIKQSLS